MLRSINTAVFCEDAFERKCAEIFYGKKNNFTIICRQCNLKLFEYADFFIHFNNVHLSFLEEEQTTDMSYAHTLLPLSAKCSSDVETSGDEQQPSPPLRIMTNLQETTHNIERDSPIRSVSNMMPSVTSDEEYTPTIMQRKLPKKTTKPGSMKGEYKCLQCNVKYMFPRNLERHMNKYHNLDSFKCQKCEQQCNSYKELQEHKRQAHLVLYNCSYCDRKLKTKKSVRIHELNHTEERNHFCDEPGCNKGFASKSRLNDHKRIVHLLKANFVCEVCGFATKRHNDLVVHRRMHTGERPFQCDVCKKSFASSTLLNEHKPMHSTERPHVCDVCGKAFSRPKALYHHKHLHLGVKKFVCKLCGRPYAQMAGLAAHMRQHREQEFRFN